jgi:hypothetical protein
MTYTPQTLTEPAAALNAEFAAIAAELAALRTQIGSGGQVGAWQTPAFANGWGNYGSPHQLVRFRKEPGGVRVVGLAKGGTSGATIFTLPDGFQPAATAVYPPGVSDAGGARVDVRVDGTVVHISGGVGYFALNFAFPTDAPTA